MSNLVKLLIGVGAIAGVVLIGIGLYHRPSKGPEPDTQAAVSEPAPTAPAQTNRPSFFTKRARRSPAQAGAQAQPMGGSGSTTNAIAGWEDKVEEILGSTSTDAEKAKQMLELFPMLPQDGQEEVAQHLSNLVLDQDYDLLRKHLIDPDLPEAVLDVLLDDVLNRANSLKLPALLEVARSAHHPKAAEAKDFLELFLEEDYGNDWNKWQVKMEEWLKDNPD
jgi:hypothetical protein